MTDREIIMKEVGDLMKLWVKYSPEYFKAVMACVDIHKLQHDMIAKGATDEELTTSAECYNDIVNYQFY